jgi:Amt family ammonium transporter
MGISWVRYGKPDVSFSLNGALAGLVAITAGASDISPAGALIIGALAGIIVVFGVEFIEKVLRVDDPVGAVAVHGLCGAFGTIMVGLFALEGGLFYGGSISLLLVQVIGVIAVAVWTMGSAYILFKTINTFIGLRVSASEEEEGLDIGEHGMDAYADFAKRSGYTL